MELEECPKCGEEYPSTWQGCPFCDSGDRPMVKMKDYD
jgi:hypothetical protein